LVNGRKFDLSLVTKDVLKHDTKKTYQKKELMTLRAKVIKDVNAFSYPSELQLDHPTIKTVVSFSATYVGQAQKDEIIDMTGFIEQDNHANTTYCGRFRSRGKRALY
jgi:predicted nucleotidyltransferase